jgi:histidyl-tRNA synthetase
MVQKLREEGWCVDYPFVAMKPDKQIKRALEVGAEFTVRIEDDEFAVLNYFETKQEEKVPFGELGNRMIQIICADDSE